jgi:ankyrin repeat protein
MNPKKRTQNRMERTSTSPEVENVFHLVTEEKIEELTAYILSEDNEVWNLKRGEDLTILHNACAIDKTNMAEAIIIQTKKRLQLTKDSSLSEEEKSENIEIFKNFINAKTQGDNQTALHYASFRGNIKIIKLLIENYADINALSSNGYNMIHKAAQGNKPSAIVYFNKKYNMDLASTDENKMNALHLSAANGMDNSVIFLLSLGLDPNIQDKFGYTALHYAVKKGHIRIIKKLLQKGADRNIQEKKIKKLLS